MADNKPGLNTLQLAGLLGTTTANILASSNTYQQGQFGVAGAEIQAGSILANAELQIGSNIANANLQISSSMANAKYQAAAALANAEMEAGRGLASADILVSDLESSALLSTTQTLIDSELQQILRRQQSDDFLYQSQRQELNGEIIGTQIELSKAAGQAEQKEIMRNLNKTDVNSVLMAVAQGRTGATINNLMAQDRARADRDIEFSKNNRLIEQANLTIQQQQALGDSKIAALSSQSVDATSKLEQQSAQIQNKFITRTTESQVDFIKKSATAEAEFGKQLALTEGNRFMEATQSKANYLNEITKLQTDYTKESSILSAQTIKSQAKIAGEISTASAISGAVSSVATSLLKYKAIV